MNFKIAVVQHYRQGGYGLIRVSAESKQFLEEGIAEVFRRYPEKPYGTTVVEGKMIQELNLTWTAYLKHYGAD